MCILGVLFRQPDEISANKILRLLPRTQSPERLKMFLTQLEEKGKIKILHRENIRIGLTTYIITQSGRDTVRNYVDAGSKDFVDVFGPTKSRVIEDLKTFWQDLTGVYPTHKTE